jgi:putative PIN family toxin of toxin-antitoxin system
MTAPLALIDTNVFVSGVITSAEDAPTAVVLDGMLSARFSFILSRDLLSEYRAVLLRPKIRRIHGLSTEDVETVLVEVAQNGRVRVVPAVSESQRSREDAHILRLLEAEPRAALVTGDRRLVAKLPETVRSFSPMEFAALLAPPITAPPRPAR